MTVGELRAVLESLPMEAPLLVGVRDRHHFNTLLGDLAVVGAVAMPSEGGLALVFDVARLS